MQQDEQVQREKIRRRRIRDFFYHLFSYLFVLALLYVSSGSGGALVWVALGWGFGVAMHGVHAYFN